MLVYQDLLTGIELLSDSFPYEEDIENGMLWEVEEKEQPSFDKKQSVMSMYIKQLVPKLDSEKQKMFKKHIEGATMFLVSKLIGFQFFMGGEGMNDEESLV